MIVRRNIYSLSPIEINTFIDAIKRVKRSGEYNRLVLLHYDNIRKVHGTPMFLPWHRALLRRFETLLQNEIGDSSFGLPYWDWTNDVSSPGQIGKLWGQEMMGGTGNPIHTGPFVPSQWITISPDGAFGDALVRNLGGSGQPVTNKEDVLRLYSSDQYDTFRSNLEFGPHGRMHVWVGGQMASVPNSVNEPVFWLHHANVDRIWAQWQELYPNVPIRAPGMDPNTVMPPTQPGVPGATVSSVINAPFSDYAYDAFYTVDVTWSDDALLPTDDNAYGLSSSPALAVFDGKLYCVRQGRGDSGWAWCATFDGTNWSKDALLPNDNNAYGLSSSPALAVFDGKLYCVRQGRDDSGWAWCSTFDGTNWSKDALLPNGDDAFGLSSSPALVSFGGKLYCVRQGRDDSGWAWCSTFDGTNWSANALLPNDHNAYGLSSSPALAVFGGKLYCVRQGRGDSGWAWCATFDGTNWSADGLLPNDDNAFGLSSSPALASFGGKLYCVRQGRGDSGWAWCATFDGTNWSADALLPNDDNAFGLSSSPALAVFGGKLYCARQGRGDSGWTWCATASLKLPGN
ncbi:hypothetical protein GNZ12_43280 [Paraburkholderia sp. 1N]|uniref:Tyrosinase copper-binding domain-containing protein n=1 Tax=Paraburkholderia solitsugae TaxID=2675748 RepID=A0ABX2C6M7_9BURK|nr:tyrosinase family protein [Paraburkholderia solitsugae]NPT47998.1 hypothetical protein [Paraburkholderia solitsugae]